MAAASQEQAPEPSAGPAPTSQHSPSPYAGARSPAARSPAARSPAAVPDPVNTPPNRLALPASVPTRLDIPRIGVHAPVHSLGLDASGAAEVPSGTRYDLPGWYRYSVTPGAIGPAVIAGHVDSARNGPSVFFQLGAMRPGDQVRVTRADSTVAEFVVDDVQTFRKAVFPTSVVYGNTDHAALRLITCGGTFDRSTGHYRTNVIVFARLVGSSPAG